MHLFILINIVRTYVEIFERTIRTLSNTFILLVQKIMSYRLKSINFKYKLQEGGKNEKCRKIKSRRLSGSFFLIHRATQGVTAQGKDYMTLFLQDKSGDIEAKLWTATKDDMQTLKPETIVHVKGDIINYRGRKQMKIHQIRLAQAEDKVSTKTFVDGAPMCPPKYKRNYRILC